MHPWAIFTIKYYLSCFQIYGHFTDKQEIYNKKYVVDNRNTVF
jgi:hypothetical protein